MLQRMALLLSLALSPWAHGDAPPVTDDLNAESVTTPSDKPFFGGPRDVLVGGRITVDVMELVAPARINELARRMQQAIKANPTWWKEHAKKVKPGEAMPYDERLGLSEQEYQDFLAASKTMTAQKKDEATLVIVMKNPDVFVLDGGQSLADLTGVEIDLKNNVVRSPFGDLTEQSDVNAPKESMLGAWQGVQWKLEKLGSNTTTGTVATLAVGKQKPSGRCVVYYDVRKFGPLGKIRISHILTFDSPAQE